MPRNTFSNSCSSLEGVGFSSCLCFFLSFLVWLVKPALSLSLSLALWRTVSWIAVGCASPVDCAELLWPAMRTGELARHITSANAETLLIIMRLLFEIMFGFFLSVIRRYQGKMKGA